MQDAETVLDVLGINHWRAVMRGNPHVRFGLEGAGKGPAPADTSPASYRGHLSVEESRSGRHAEGQDDFTTGLNQPAAR
jgi:hypothetical protein